MTTTPTVWKDSYVVNAGNTTGSQFDPVTIGLANNRFLTVWTDNTNNVDTEPGYDNIGQIYDASGNPVGNPFAVNNSYFNDNEQHPAIAALPDGGFVIAFVDLGTGSGNDYAVRFERYDANGTQTANGTIADGNIGSTFDDHPSISVLSNGNYVITYEETVSGSNANIYAKVVDGTNNTVGAQLTAAQDSSDSDSLPDTTVLTNGTIVTAYQEVDGSTTGIEVQGINSSGTFQFNVSPTSGVPSYEPKIAALNGGGFVTVWTDGNNSDVHAAIYDNTGGTVKSDFALLATSDDINEPQVVALKDGGFYVVWDNDTSASEGLYGARYDASGNLVGAITKIVSGGNTSPDVSLTTDGRIILTYSDNTGEISELILDPRDQTINGGNNNDVITSRVDGATLFGMSGNDTLIGNVGNDTLIGGFSIDTVYGGDGNDIIKVFEGEYGDYVYGGIGKDLLDLSGLTTDKANVNLQTGVWTTSMTSQTLAVFDIESVNGGGNDDTIVGDDANGNHINGGAGNDFLQGGGGNDTLIGGAGTDTLFGGEDNDLYVLSNGHDIVVDSGGTDTATSTISRSLHDLSGVENLTLLGSGNLTGRGDDHNNTIKGNDHNNKLYGEGGHDKLYGYGGNDTLDGGTNSDTMYGGTGNDTYIVNSTSDKVSEASGGGTDIVKSSVTWKLASGFENLTLTGTSKVNGTGTSGNNIITGNSAHNVLTGGGGSDAFVFKTALVSANYDTITDFDHTTDRFNIDNSVFKGLTTGTLAANDFKLISSATSTAGVDTSDRILYDRDHGNIYFDQDGSKTGHSRILFAHVDNGTFLNNTDFHII